MPKKKEPLRPEHIAEMRRLLVDYRRNVTNISYSQPIARIEFWRAPLVAALLGNAEFFLDAADAQLSKERS